MTEKRLCKFSLTGYQCLVFYRLIQEGKRIILVGDNKFKVVDGDAEWLIMLLVMWDDFKTM